jgi:hypothetical protein
MRTRSTKQIGVPEKHSGTPIFRLTREFSSRKHPGRLSIRHEKSRTASKRLSG